MMHCTDCGKDVKTWGDVRGCEGCATNKTQQAFPAGWPPDAPIEQLVPWASKPIKLVPAA